MLDRPGSPIEGLTLPAAMPVPHAPGMFAITEAEAAAIRTVFEQRGEFAAAVELRRLFPCITDNGQARECVRIPRRGAKRACPVMLGVQSRSVVVQAHP
jgi:hypothetical protein